MNTNGNASIKEDNNLKKLMNTLYILIIFIIMSPVIQMKKNFIFSVIMAIHNTGRYLDQSIGSLLNQTLNFEVIQIILINDGSIDNSEEICLKYKKL